MMRSNPFFFSLARRVPELKAQTSEKQKSFYMPPINKAPSKRIFILSGKKYSIESEHLSVFEEHNDEDITSPIHYTLKLLSETNKKETVHIYYDKDSYYISTHIQKNKSSQKKLKLSAEEVTAFKDYAEERVRDELNRLSHELSDNKKKAHLATKEMLKNLETESRAGTTSHAYISLLEKTIKKIIDHERLSFDPEHTDQEIKKFLIRYQANLKNSMDVKSSQKKLLAEPPETKEEIDVEPETILSVEHESGSTTVRPASKTLTKTKQLQQELKTKRRDINARLNKAKTLDEAITIINELDKLKISEADILIQACIEGDIDFCERFFKKTSWDALDPSVFCALLPTCVYHNRIELFDYLYKDVLKSFMIRHAYDDPFISLQPLNKFLNCGSPALLNLAYEIKNLPFFELLLTRYKYDTLKIPIVGNPLLIHIILNHDNEFLTALLKAGSNPSERLDHNITSPHFKSLPPEFKQNNLKVNSVQDGRRTALHFAVIVGNSAAVKLLLEHGASMLLKCTEEFTPFGTALTHDLTLYNKKNKNANEEIITLFLNNGHKIDERHGKNSATGLFLACKRSLPAHIINILLNRGADPCAEHKGSMNATHPIQVLTPLLVAAYKYCEGPEKNKEKILQRLLECPINRKDIKYASETCKKIYGVIPPALLKKYMAICQHDALQAHKEGKEKKDTHKLNKAIDLYNKMLQIAEQEDLKHGILFNLGTCHAAAGNQENAIKALNQCLTMRIRLATNPIKAAGLEPLINKAREKIEEINNPAQQPLTSTAAPLSHSL